MTLENIYLMAVKHHDMETAGALVESAARKAGFDVGPVYHGCNSEKGFTVFGEDGNNSGQNPQMRGFFFSGSRSVAEAYSQGSGNVRAFYLKMANPLRIDERNSDLSLHEIQQEAEKHLRGLDSIFDGQPDEPDGLVVEGSSSGAGMKTHTEYVVFSPEQIKSAVPVAHDDDGNIVLPDKRFVGSSDIRGEVSEHKPSLSGKSGGRVGATKQARKHH